MMDTSVYNVIGHSVADPNVKKWHLYPFSKALLFPPVCPQKEISTLHKKYKQTPSTKQQLALQTVLLTHLSGSHLKEGVNAPGGNKYLGQH